MTHQQELKIQVAKLAQKGYVQIDVRTAKTWELEAAVDEAREKMIAKFRSVR
jgi:hypothetical protein